MVLCLFHVLLGSTLCPLSFCSNLSGDERAGCFTLFIFMVSYHCYCSVVPPDGAVGWSAVCDCGIS